MNLTEWTPPHEPDPWEILHSAVDDTAAGAYEQALAKFVWFHRNAVQHRPSLAAVRLSFALSYWQKLAAAYEPAQDAFIQARDDAEAAFLRDKSNFELFHELAALNDRLGEGIRTADLFAELAEGDHTTAASFYHVAEPFMIAAGRYQACGPFLDPARRVQLAADCYHLTESHEESKANGEMPIPKVARKRFVRDVATLAALLAMNHRAAEANDVYASALRILSDDEFRKVMDAAMNGELPGD